MKLAERKKLNNSSEVTVAKQNMRRHAAVAGVSLVLIVALILGGTVAWYTRLVNVTGMTFEVAAFDINASYVEGSFIINPNDYTEIADGKAAPGSMGYIPVEITSSASNEVAVEYTLNVNDTAMAPEFSERIRFYYYTLENGEYVEHDLGFGEEDIRGTLPVGGSAVTEYIYWEWEYTADISALLTAGNVTSLSDMTNTEIYTAWNDGGRNNWSDSTSQTVLNALYNGTATTATTTIPSGVEDGDDVTVETTYPAVSNSDSDTQKKQRGANMRDYIENHYMYQWDYVDTQVALGYWDESFTSTNEITYEKTEVEVSDGTTTTTETYTAYQMAMQVTLSMVGAQAEPIEQEDVQDDTTTGAGTVKLESTTTTTE